MENTMLIKPARWEKNEIYANQYLIWFVVNFLYIQNKDVKFEDIVWIIALANKIMFNRHLDNAVNVEIFNMFDFPKNITPDLYKLNNVSLKKQLDCVSIAQLSIIEESCRKWKLYGKYIVKFKTFLKG